MKKLRILVLYEKDLITETFSIKFKVIQPLSPIDVCLSFVLLFTICIIVVTQKLVLQQSKNVTAKCTETLSPPPSIQYFLGGKNITGCGEFKVISCFVEKFHFYIILESRKDDATFVIKASYLEIYNEKVKRYRKNGQQKNVYFLTMSDLESVTPPPPS